MIGQWKRPASFGTKTTRHVSHLECWYNNANNWLDDHPYTPVIQAGPGRPVKYTQDQIVTRRNLQNNIKRWTVKQQDYVGQGMWATAGMYGDRVSVARSQLNSMNGKVD